MDGVRMVNTKQSKQIFTEKLKKNNLQRSNEIFFLPYFLELLVEHSKFLKTERLSQVFFLKKGKIMFVCHCKAWATNFAVILCLLNDNVPLQKKFVLRKEIFSQWIVGFIFDYRFKGRREKREGIELNRLIFAMDLMTKPREPRVMVV
eukprot:Lithocolla_globosa_v1_NODE_5864_length_1173_cov_4.224508.p1 type:complete len:148 gc:universal NODE_5864_length_1173_cov_4.224508:717-274(-)